MNKYNEQQESEAFMGFSISREIQEQIIKMVCDPTWGQQEAKEIPGANGQVLVKEGTQAFFDRRDEKGIIMIPVKLKAEHNGAEVEVLFFVCSK